MEKYALKSFVSYNTPSIRHKIEQRWVHFATISVCPLKALSEHDQNEKGITLTLKENACQTIKCFRKHPV